MAWVTLALRKQTLQAEINELTYQNIELSRNLRQVHRHLSYETSIFEGAKSRELKEIKGEYDELRKNRVSVGEEGYQEWKDQFEIAREEYQAQKQDIEDYYDVVKKELEEEAQADEDRINDEQTRVETQRQAMQSELEAIKEEIKTEIQNEAIKF